MIVELRVPELDHGDFLFVSDDLLIILRRHLVPLQRIPTMPKHHLRPRPLLQHMYLLTTAHPVIMVPRQPPLRQILLKDLIHMIHIRREDPRSRLLQIHLHHTQPWRMSWGMMQIDPLTDLEILTGKGTPIQIKGHL